MILAYLARLSLLLRALTERGATGSWLATGCCLLHWTYFSPLTMETETSPAWRLFSCSILLVLLRTGLSFTCVIVSFFVQVLWCTLWWSWSATRQNPRCWTRRTRSRGKPWWEVAGMMLMMKWTRRMNFNVDAPETADFFLCQFWPGEELNMVVLNFFFLPWTLYASETLHFSTSPFGVCWLQIKKLWFINKKYSCRKNIMVPIFSVSSCLKWLTLGCGTVI